MTSKVEQALEQEIAELQAALAATPQGQKLARLVEVLNLYRGLANFLSSTPASGAPFFEPGQPAPARMTLGSSKTGRGRSPERQAILDGAAAFLMEWGNTPQSTGAILRHLDSCGIQVPGKNPSNNLSAMLSNSPVFKSNGRAGWTVAENENPAGAESLTEEAPTGLIEDLREQVEPQAQGGEARPGGGT